ncbi:MAG: hypothetical protein ACE5R4_06310 [Armatimonadota bacterium]
MTPVELMARATVWLAVATFAAVIVALFQERIRQCWLRTKLGVPQDGRNPVSELMSWRDPRGDAEVACCYVRLRVGNIGKRPAHNVEAFAAALQEERADGGWAPRRAFLPVGLQWTHVDRTYLPVIHSGTEKLCDLAYVLDPDKRALYPGHELAGIPEQKRGLLSLACSPKPRQLPQMHNLPPGKYRLKVLIAAANAATVETTVEINLTGEWRSGEADMLREGLGARLV